MGSCSSKSSSSGHRRSISGKNYAQTHEPKSHFEERPSSGGMDSAASDSTASSPSASPATGGTSSSSSSSSTTSPADAAPSSEQRNCIHGDAAVPQQEEDINSPNSNDTVGLPVAVNVGLQQKEQQKNDDVVVDADCSNSSASTIAFCDARDSSSRSAATLSDIDESDSLHRHSNSDSGPLQQRSGSSPGMSGSGDSFAKAASATRSYESMEEITGKSPHLDDDDDDDDDDVPLPHAPSAVPSATQPKKPPYVSIFDSEPMMLY